MAEFFSKSIMLRHWMSSSTGEQLVASFVSIENCHQRHRTRFLNMCHQLNAKIVHAVAEYLAHRQVQIEIPHSKTSLGPSNSPAMIQILEVRMPRCVIRIIPTRVRRGLRAILELLDSRFHICLNSASSSRKNLTTFQCCQVFSRISHCFRENIGRF